MTDAREPADGHRPWFVERWRLGWWFHSGQLKWQRRWIRATTTSVVFGPWVGLPEEVSLVDGPQS